MNHARLFVILVVLFGDLTLCSAQTRGVDASPGELTFQRVLLSGQVKVYPTLADVNADRKPDLLIGSMGHDFEAKTSRIVFPKELGLELSIHRNISSDSKVSFDEPYWPKGLDEQCRLPHG